MEVSGQLHSPAALTPGKSTLYPLDRRLDEPQNRSGLYEEVKILDHNWTQTSILRSSSPQSVAMPTSLFQLLKRIFGLKEDDETTI
jgi:hypothetical protein